MARQLFLHHYFPALYFAILLLCGVFDLVTSTLRPRVRLQIAAVLAIIAIWNFVHFSPLAYGSPWTKAECNRSKWLKTWDFSCNDFLGDVSVSIWCIIYILTLVFQYSHYDGLMVATPTKPVTPVATVGGEPGGRPAMIVEDKPQEAAPAEHTSVVVGMPEPGRDIFAGQPVKEVPSQPVPPQPPVVEVEEKVISAVVQPPPAAEAIEKEKEPVDAAGEDPVPLAKEIPLPKDEDEAVVGADEEADVDAEAKLVKEAGPLGEAEAEADKIAHELYPDDAD